LAGVAPRHTATPNRSRVRARPKPRTHIRRARPRIPIASKIRRNKVSGLQRREGASEARRRARHCGSHAGDRPNKAAAEFRASGLKVAGPGGSQREVTYCLDRALNERLMAYIERCEAKRLPRRLRIGYSGAIG
jgi:hypothetical protein